MFKRKFDRLDYISEDFPSWSNATRNVRMMPLRIFSPETKEDVVAIIEDARKKGITVHPIGAGHSFSEAAREDYYAIRPLALTECSKYTMALKNGVLKERKHLVKVQSGIRVKCLNKKLYKMGYALNNMGAFDWQTISGAISTGTHGSGINRPAMQDQVRAVILILSSGETWQIEPLEGITDPALFNHDAGIKLVQNDDIFYSTVLSLGAMGFIYEFILEVDEKYWLEETRKILNWDTELKPALLDGRFKQWV
ncbi:MAG: FAD-dependent oxidoreductase, partial [Saprospiraceae bacterium]